MQEFNGTLGTYTQQNVEKQRSYNLPEWKTLTEETQHQPPARRGERRRNQEKVVRGGGNLRGRAAAVIATADTDGSPKPKRKPGRPRRTPLAMLATEDQESGDEKGKRDGRAQNLPTPDSPAIKPAKGKPNAKPRGRPAGKGQAKSVTSRRLNNTAEAADFVDEADFKNFDYRMDGLDEFTPERCAELETHYWKSLGFNQPMYAADMPGSLFDDTTTSWNVAKLENLLDVLGTKVPGVNTAYLYMGMWKATFAWHLEDVDLYSINYIHFGAPKQWYSISQEDARKFEAAMKANWPVDAKSCDQFLRHKTYLISPDVLAKQYNVKVNKLVHYEGEFVITYPYGYHSGYNLGYNCAESVNFATESWLDYGRIARKCNCEADNVWVDVSEIERKLRGEPTPEYYEETDDDDDNLSGNEDGNLPSPPASVKGKAQRGKKRKRDVKEEKPKKKKKIRIKIKAPTREPCVMCPNDNPWEPLLPTDTGKKAHRSCALFTPETWVDKDDSGLERVCGVATIDRARLDLKCNFCRSKRGACFQCSSKKCTRAFHATCALAAGVLIDGGLVPTFGTDGTEYFEEGYDFRCKYHRPKMPKKVDIDALESSKRIHNFAKDLKYNDVVQAQYVGGEVFAGSVVENRPSELSVVVDVLPEGYVCLCYPPATEECRTNGTCSDRIEVEWKWLCVLNPDDSLRPKPTAGAIPMPEGMNKKQVSVNNRQDGVPTTDEPFHDDPQYKWCDFYNVHMPPPAYQSVKLQTPARLTVNLDASDQLYYYLPNASTEAKCFFTDTAGSTAIAAKANFLERVNVKPIAQPSRILAAAKPPVRPVASQPPVLKPWPMDNRNSETPHQGIWIAKPYIYKPREPARPNLLWGVDPQSLATQRSFLAEAGRRPSEEGIPMAQSDYPDDDPSVATQPLRPFSREHYYSTETLPAAYPGQYSSFTQLARRRSQGAPSLQRPSSHNGGHSSDYAVSEQRRTDGRQRAPTAPMLSHPSSASLPPNQYASNSSRPSSSAQSHPSPRPAPLTPATSISTTSKPETPPGFLDNLQRYPYLRNSYLRSRGLYESPYTIGGGFSSSYQAPALERSTGSGTEKFPVHTPSTSISSLADIGRRTSSQWTPPSQMWHSAGVSNQQTTPPPQQQQAVPARKYPLPTYQTPYDFQQSCQILPSTASRDGAQARLMRDYGYGAYAAHGHAQPHRNSFGHPYDTAKMWQSPKAPTPSPLSDPNTPGLQQYTPPMSAGAWSSLPMPGGAPPVMQQPHDQHLQQQHQQHHTGYGPTLPQMHGGSETWRYN